MPEQSGRGVRAPRLVTESPVEGKNKADTDWGGASRLSLGKTATYIRLWERRRERNFPGSFVSSMQSKVWHFPVLHPSSPWNYPSLGERGVCATAAARKAPVLGEHPRSHRLLWRSKGGTGSRQAKMLLLTRTPFLGFSHTFSSFSSRVRLELG